MIIIKILLIYVRGDYSVHVPYGVLQIAAVLEKKGYDVQVIDPLFKDWSADLLKKIKPDVIGLSYLSFNIVQTRKIIQDIKNYDKSIPIIAGGSHPTIKPKEAIEELNVDFAVIGEGEKIIPNLLNEMKKKRKSFKKIKGIAFKDKNGNFIKTKKEDLIENIDELPFPARHLINMENYLIPPGYIRSVFLNRVGTLYTSRGCSYMCSFCAIPVMFRRSIRFHSIKYVIKQVKHLIRKYNIDGIYFSDEIFTVDRDRTIVLCKELKKLRLPWATQTRIDLVDGELLKVMAESGCVQIDYGVESGSDRILKVMKKETDTKNIIKTFYNTKKAGIRSFATITIGHPTETSGDLQKTVELVKKIRPNFTLVQYLTPIPGTNTYYWAIKNNKIKEDYYKDINYHFYTSNKPLVNLSNVSDKTLTFFKNKIDRLTFKWNYLSTVNLHNFYYLIGMLFYNLIDLPSLFKDLRELYNSKNIDQFVVSLLNNYHKQLVLKKN